MSAYQGSLITDRTGGVPDPTYKEIRYWMWHITVTPSFNVKKESDPDTYYAFKNRLGQLGDALLSDTMIKKYLEGNPMYRREGFGGGGHYEEQPKQWHLDRIIEITNKGGSMEDDGVHKKLHLHVSFTAKHRSNLGVNQPAVKAICGVYLRDWVNPDSIYVGVRSRNAANFFVEYIAKNKKFDDEVWEGPSMPLPSAKEIDRALGRV